MQYKDYYKTLGVDRKATAKDVKSAFRKLAKQYHPDQNPNQSAKAAERFKDINEAYEVLGDAAKRQQYDSLGDGTNFNMPPGWGGSSPQSSRGGYSGGGAVNLDDLLGGFGGANGPGGFSDFFEAFFGGKMPNDAPSAAARSARRSNYGSTTSGSTAYSGSGGGHPTGARRRADGLNDPTDTGTNQAELTLEVPLKTVALGGTHYFYNPYTGQNGEVSLPKGVKQGAKLRLANQGPAMGNGQRQPLLLMIQYQAHDLFKVEGLNLAMDIVTPIDVLVLGGEVQVTTLTQGVVTLSVPAGSQPDRKMRLKGLGIANTSSTGDLTVTLKAQLPTEVDAPIKAAFEHLRQLRLNTSVH